LLAAAVLWGAEAGLALAGPAIGQFEMKQVATEAGEIEFQSQNAYTSGQPGRRVAEDDGELVYDDNTVTQARNALELEVSWTNWLRTRIGIEYEKERIDEPASPAGGNEFAALQLSEYAFESVVVLLPIKGDGFGVAWLTEFEMPLDRAEPMDLTVGPLIEARRGAWRVLLNLYLIRFMGGDPPEPGAERDNKWDFGYAAQVKYDHSDRISLALEAYGTVDRLGRSGAPTDEALLFGDADQHRMGPVVYYTVDLGPRLDLAPWRAGDDENASARFGVGAFVGLTENTPDATLKLSLEVEF
jgi:hypothetical protein